MLGLRVGGAGCGLAVRARARVRMGVRVRVVVAAVPGVWLPAFFESHLAHIEQLMYMFIVLEVLVQHLIYLQLGVVVQHFGEDPRSVDFASDLIISLSII